MKKKAVSLPLDTIVDVYAKKDAKIIKKTMKYGEFLSMDLAKGWVYDIYQEGFCTIKPTE